MQIVMAEMGLKNYTGRGLRTKKVFDGVGNLENRQKYIRYRLAFLRALFCKLGMKTVELYRGMSSEWDWKTEDLLQNRYWSSWTFNYKVAQDFADLDPATKYKNSYLLKRAIPVESLFMTFLETDAMNRQYKEAEAIILHEDHDRFLW